jgi:alkylation response protein AidB-like acyl-CoA dehydrogenase
VEAETRYHPSADQFAVAAALEESLADLLPLSRLHTAAHESEATWAGLEEIGLFTIAASEESGGSGLGVVEEALIALGLGRHLASPGVLATIGAAPLQAAGTRRTAAAYRQGRKIIVVDEPGAQCLLLREGGNACLHAADLGGARTLDDRLWRSSLREADGVGEPLARLDQDQLLRLRLLDAAALAGIAESALQAAVAYAGLRQQFGKPIGSFQAVKHHCANMVTSARCARDQASYAAVALAEGRADARLQVECALLVAGTAALDNAGLNIQIHGGIGFSDEADAHLFLKRAQVLIAVAGGLEAANRRVAEAQSGE